MKKKRKLDPMWESATFETGGILRKSFTASIRRLKKRLASSPPTKKPQAAKPAPSK